MSSFIGNNCTFENDNVRNKIAEGLVNYVLFHNEVIRSRSDQRTYAKDNFGNISFDPYPTNEYVTFDDRIKGIKTDKTKKFVSISPAIKKWIGYICSRVAYECDTLYNELASRMKSGTIDLSALDNVMFSNSFEMNMFRLVAKIVGNHAYLLKTFMNVPLLESELSTRIYERYERQHSLRPYNKNIADWISKLLDDFFKVIAVHISTKNWFDRDATVNEKNLPSILWLLAENTEYHESLSTFFIYVMALTTEEKETVAPTNMITFDMSHLNDEAAAIMATKIEPKRGRAKKAEPNKVTVLPAATPPIMTAPPVALPTVSTQLPPQLQTPQAHQTPVPLSFSSPTEITPVHTVQMPQVQMQPIPQYQMPHQQPVPQYQMQQPQPVPQYQMQQPVPQYQMHPVQYQMPQYQMQPVNLPTTYHQ